MLSAMTNTADTDQALEVVDALAQAIQLALDAGYDADEIIDTVGAMVYAATQH